MGPGDAGGCQTDRPTTEETVVTQGRLTVQTVATWSTGTLTLSVHPLLPLVDGSRAPGRRPARGLTLPQSRRTRERSELERARRGVVGTPVVVGTTRPETVDHSHTTDTPTPPVYRPVSVRDHGAGDPPRPTSTTPEVVRTRTHCGPFHRCSVVSDSGGRIGREPRGT